MDKPDPVPYASAHIRGRFFVGDESDKLIALSSNERNTLVETQATCPFIGSAVARGKLAVRHSADNPLASIEDVRQLGNSGGGDLGELLVLFAGGNHAFMRGDAGKPDKKVPDGLFSLEFPGSQGSHPGHSGILQGDPALPGSGRLSRSDFARLAVYAKQGLVKRSDVAVPTGPRSTTSRTNACWPCAPKATPSGARFTTF